MKTIYITPSSVAVGEIATLIFTNLNWYSYLRLFESVDGIFFSEIVFQDHIIKNTPGTYYYYYEEYPFLPFFQYDISNIVSLTVIANTYTISLDSNIEIIYGQSLSNSMLSGIAINRHGIRIEGNFTFNNISQILNVGSHNVDITFTPYDTNYNSLSQSIALTIIKATPSIIKLPLTSNILLGQSLSNIKLFGGSANVSGIFSFTNLSQQLNVGRNTVNITFTPNDTTNYNNVSDVINVMVMENKINILNMSNNIILDLGSKTNVYNLNPYLPQNLYKFYSSDSDIVTIDIIGNIKVKKLGKFYIIVTDMEGNIIYTTPYYIEVK